MREHVSGSGWLRLVVLTIVLLTAAACAGSSALSPVGSSRNGGGAGQEGQPAASAAPSAAGQDKDNGGRSGSSGGPVALKDDAKIVYTGSLQLVVADLEPALARAKAAVAALGGYVGASRESNDDGQPKATITYRIPSTRWQDALEALRGLAVEVVSEETQATEVGAQLVDLEARLRTLRASETSLQAIAASSGKVTDLLEVERRLTEVRGQIESLDAQRALLADQVAYGTLVVSFGPNVVAVTEAAQQWDPATEVDHATATLLSVVQGLVTMGIWFVIVWLPFLVLLAIVVVLGRRLVRRWSRRDPGAGGPRDAIPGWNAGPTG